MRKLPHLGLLFTLSLFAACTCVSAKIENTTEQPIFVSEVDHIHGGIYEDFGFLVLPGKSVSIPIYGGQDVRARDMRGNTVFYSPAPADKDSAFEVASLEPVPNARPLGSPYVGSLGANSPWSLETCRNGEKVTIREYGLLATVRNESATPLIAAVDQYPGQPVHDWKEGVLAPPGQVAQIYANVTEEPYVRAFDQQGRLVYVERLMRTEYPVAVIPATLPPDSPVRPASPYDNDCLGINGLLKGHVDAATAATLVVAAAVFGAFVIGGLVAMFLVVRFFWNFYVGKRSS